MAPKYSNEIFDEYSLPHGDGSSRMTINHCPWWRKKTAKQGVSSRTNIGWRVVPALLILADGNLPLR